MRTLLIALTLATGCGTLSIGRAPTELDLANDGSKEQQQRIEKKYALAYDHGMIVRPGATTEDVAAEINEPVEATRTPAFSENAADYLSTSAPADEATDTVVVGFDRFAHSSVPTIVIEIGGILIGSAAAVTATIAQTGASFTPANVGLVSENALSGAFTGFVVALPIEIIYGFTVPVLSSSLASPDYRKGVRAFNKDLAARIQGSGKKAAAPAPTTPTTPPPEEPKPVEPPPAG